ncbi:MAG: phage holin family protein [Bryobacteraceae bacterium]|jgi:putative membrane protein
MVYLIVNWVSSVLSLLAVASLVPGCQILEFESALVATGVVGLISAGLGALLKQASGAISLVLSSLFLLIVDTLLFRMSALVVPGFVMRGFTPAIAGAVVLLALNLVLPRVAPLKEDPLDSWTRS